MPPKACIDGGCDDRITSLEDFREHLENPESGALGQIHEKINKKVSWASLGTVTTIFLFVIAGAFAYTTISNANIRNEQKDANVAQDKRIDDLIKALQENNANSLAALNAINEHRAYTEGIKIGQKKKNSE